MWSPKRALLAVFGMLLVESASVASPYATLQLIIGASGSIPLTGGIIGALAGVVGSDMFLYVFRRIGFQSMRQFLSTVFHLPLLLSAVILVPYYAYRGTHNLVGALRTPAIHPLVSSGSTSSWIPLITSIVATASLFVFLGSLYVPSPLSNILIRGERTSSIQAIQDYVATRFRRV